MEAYLSHVSRCSVQINHGKAFGSKGGKVYSFVVLVLMVLVKIRTILRGNTSPTPFTPVEQEARCLAYDFEDEDQC